MCVPHIGPESLSLLQVHVCLHQGTATQHYWLTLAKGMRDRAGEDSVASSLVMAALHRACRSEEQQQIPPQLLGLQPEEQLQVCFSCISQ